ncbi:hypothetical protein OF83DRAFT_624425 [Amylostereum chailletii]|nr:hypothetical protein OF83DRAFT_624425 [Amylostereum chailletii]
MATSNAPRDIAPLKEKHPSPPRLNEDVLLLLARFLDTQTLVSFLKISRTFHASSPFFLLRGAVKITRASGLLSLHSFLCRDEAQHLPLFLHLHISLSHDEISLIKPEDVRVLCHVLKRAACLKTLEISQCGCHEDHDRSRVAWSYSLLGPVITACAGITHLKLHNFTQEYLTSTLARAPSSLVTLHLDFSWRSPNILNIAADIRLGRFASTLEELTLLGDFLCFKMESTVKFLRLQRLTMAKFDEFIMPDVITSFPRAIELQFSQYSGLLPNPSAMRTWSKHYQAEHPPWSRLERVSGSLRSLYTAGLVCPVHRLDIVGYISKEKHLRRLHAVLEDAQPRILVLTLSPANDGLESRLFPTSVAGSLRSLILVVDFAHASIHFIEETISDRINRLVALSIPPPTTIMVVSLKLTVLTEAPTTTIQPAIDALNSVPKEDLARRLSTRHPSLSAVFVNVQESDFRYGWTISRGDAGTPGLELMDSEVLEEIVQREGLRASPVLVADGG